LRKGKVNDSTKGKREKERRVMIMMICKERMLRMERERKTTKDILTRETQIIKKMSKTSQEMSQDE